MTNVTDQQRVGNFMGALSHLLCGKPRRHAEFIRKVELIVSGTEPHAMQLLQAEPTLRRTGTPLLWVQPTENVHVPRIGLAALCGNQAFFVENCALWMAPGDDRARLVPDSFDMGAFQLKSDLRLRYSRKAPATFDDAMPGMVRAYDRLLDLQIRQRERGDVFELPVLQKAA